MYERENYKNRGLPQPKFSSIFIGIIVDIAKTFKIKSKGNTLESNFRKVCFMLPLESAKIFY